MLLIALPILLVGIAVPHQGAAPGQQKGATEKPGAAPRLLNLVSRKPEPRFLTFSADGKWFAYGWEGAIHVYDLAQGKAVHRLTKEPQHPYPAEAIFAPTGNRLLVGFEYSPRWLWDPDAGKFVPLEIDPRKASGGFDGEYAFTPDGRSVVNRVLRPGGACVQVWDATTGKQVRHLAWEAGSGVAAFRLSDDGKTLLAEHRKQVRSEQLYADTSRVTTRVSVRLWDLASGDCLGAAGRPVEVTHREIRGKEGPPDKYPHGARLRAVGAADHGCRVRLSPAGWVMVFPRDPPGAGLEVERGSIEKGYPLCLRDLRTGAEVHRFAELGGEKVYTIYTHALSSDNRRLAVSGRLESSGHSSLLLLDVSRWRDEAVRSRKGPTEKELAACWEDLGAEDPLRALRAARRLAASPEQGLPFLEDRLRPVSDSDPDRQKHIAALIAQLDDTSFPARERAERALLKLGADALPAVRQALAGKPSEEARRRLEGIAAKLPEVPAPDAATRRLLWGIELLERWGTPAARLLERLAQGAPDAWATHEARASLELLRQRPKTAN
jgi:hypothetical protein